MRLLLLDSSARSWTPVISTHNPFLDTGLFILLEVAFLSMNWVLDVHLILRCRFECKLAFVKVLFEDWWELIIILSCSKNIQILSSSLQFTQFNQQLGPNFLHRVHVIDAGMAVHRKVVNMGSYHAFHAPNTFFHELGVVKPHLIS